MPRIYLVRHGQAAGGFGEDLDPGLSELGWTQAKAARDALAGKGPLDVISSPLRRCQETANPLSEQWGVTPKIVPEVAEIPSPTDDLTARTEWLRSIMPGTWTEIGDPSLETWRQNCVSAVQALQKDTVVFSHFIAINVIVGSIQQDDRMVVFRPNNCSITTIDVASDSMSLVSLGDEAETQVR